MRYDSPSIERREMVQGLMTFNHSFDWREWCEQNPQFCYKRSS